MFLTLRRHFSTYVFRLICPPPIMDILKPPQIVRGITDLDRNLFEKIIRISYLSLKNVKISMVLPVVKKYLLKLDNFKPIHHGMDAICVYLNPERINAWEDFPSETQSTLQDLSVTQSDLGYTDITLKYENFSVEDVLRAILPADKEGMSSFTKIGHIVHVNLREHLLPYKNVIGEVLLDKVTGCKSVVNKTNSIDNTYRNFTMEVLKGDTDMLTTVKENTCVFKFDFSTVYWNSRLCTEHERIVKMLHANDVLFDVFAGVGPFAIPAAKKKCYVYANDLNPESFKWLEYNAKINKINGEYFKAFNKDGCDFIKEEFKENLLLHLKKKQNIYVAMNLPAMAVQFLHCFIGLFKANDFVDFEPAPTLFLYCFVKGEDCISLARNLVKQSFDFDISNRILNIFKVRTVSSMKEMMRVTVQLDRDLLLGNIGSKRKLENCGESEAKKRHVGGNDGEEQEEIERSV